MLMRLFFVNGQWSAIETHQCVFNIDTSLLTHCPKKKLAISH